MRTRLARARPERAPWPFMEGRPRLHTLHPGDVACALRGEELETLLGSCVAVILTDPRRTVAAMCHIVHTVAVQDPGRRTSAHGTAAFDAMDRLLIARGIQPQMCDAWVFGGGNMFPDLYRKKHIGDSNADWVMHMLAQRGVRVLRDDLGGRYYRRVRWTVGDEEPQVHCVPV
ncbi:chemotaxis protein CheD [Hydrogenophaga sp. RWCD_12]|uniref:chemotaxis protein CheD n=1 Tax=Hydrogenophaga sp. RWCD_12 TaxID=3391190 RepID=UPI003984B4F8